MRDVELYRDLLGLEPPWVVGQVELRVEDGRVDVWAQHASGRPWPCPECGRELGLHDHSEERAWRHLDSCQFMTFVHARPPRVRCPDHGVRQVKLPWAEPHSRFTALFERLAIDVLRETDVLGAGRILRLSWDEAWHIMERAVARGQLAKPARVTPYIGVDEKAVASGQNYITVVSDLVGNTVEHISDERKQESLDVYFDGLTPEQLQGIEAVGMDMWEPFAQSVRRHLDDADEKIVFDRFHIMQHMVRAVDDVRKAENRNLRAVGDDILVKSKYLWLYSRENVPDRDRRHFWELRRIDLKTSRAWAVKENLRVLWSYHHPTWAARHWRRWFNWATHSRLEPVAAAAWTIKRHLPGVMAYFKHRITNAGSEALNSKIQTIRRNARGFRNRDHLKTSIYFHCGGLDLYPRTHAIAG